MQPRLPQLETERLTLRLGDDADVPEVIRFFRENNSFFAKTQTPRTGPWLMPSFWRTRFERARAELLNDRSCQLLVFEHGKKRVIATVNFTSVTRGHFHACYLGYLLAETKQGKGVMHEAVRAGIDYMFNERDLHRIMAAYAPDNVRSGRVLERLGFVIEGRAPEYLRINGVWTEHVLTALTNRNFRGDFD